MFVFNSFILTIIFTALSALHFYWTFGGMWGSEAALPVDANGRKVLNPKKIDTLIVSLLLLGIAFFYFDLLCVTKLIPVSLDFFVWVLPILFFLRSVGEFKYVGFFKKIKGSKFASYDTKYYSPLCLLIALLMLPFAIDYFW